MLDAQTPSDKREENIFDIINQLNRGSDLITSTADRRRLAELNLVAAKRAKGSTAFASAVSYLTIAHGFLSEAVWDESYDLAFSIETFLAECELFNGDPVAAEDRLAKVAQRVKTRHHLALATRLQRDVYMALNRTDHGVELCLAGTGKFAKALLSRGRRSVKMVSDTSTRLPAPKACQNAMFFDRLALASGESTSPKLMKTQKKQSNCWSRWSRRSRAPGIGAHGSVGGNGRNRWDRGSMVSNNSVQSTPSNRLPHKQKCFSTAGNVSGSIRLGN